MPRWFKGTHVGHVVMMTSRLPARRPLTTPRDTTIRFNWDIFINFWHFTIILGWIFPPTWSFDLARVILSCWSFFYCLHQSFSLNNLWVAPLTDQTHILPLHTQQDYWLLFLISVISTQSLFQQCKKGRVFSVKYVWFMDIYGYILVF